MRFWRVYQTKAPFWTGSTNLLSKFFDQMQKQLQLDWLVEESVSFVLESGSVEHLIVLILHLSS